MHLFHLPDKILLYYTKALLAAHVYKTWEIISAHATENKYSGSKRNQKSSLGEFKKQVGKYTEDPELDFVNAARASSEDLPYTFFVFGITGLPEAASYQTKKQHSSICSLLLYPYRHEGKLKLRSANIK